MGDRKTHALHRFLCPLRWRWKKLRRFCRRRFFWFALLATSLLLLFLHLSRESSPNDLPPVAVDVDAHSPSRSLRNCSHFSCFDVFRCNSLDKEILSVHLAKPMSFYSYGQPMDLPVSAAFQQIRKSVLESPFHTGRREDACIFIPSVDFLSVNASRSAAASLALASSPGWNGNGRNHLIFSLRPHTRGDFQLDTGAAMVASPGFSRRNYRQGFDVAVPFHFVTNSSLEDHGTLSRSTMLVILTVFVQESSLSELTDLEKNLPGKVVLVPVCRGSPHQPFCQCGESAAPLNFSASGFCMAIQPLTVVLLEDMLSAGCIPVIPSDSDFLLPFEEVLDWSRSVVYLHEPLSNDSVEYLNRVPSAKMAEMRKNGRFFWDRYFSSLSAIVQTTLQVINDRIFTKTARTYENWNVPGGSDQPPIFISELLPKSLAFTAVILTFDRRESLFQLISLLARCPSLAKVLVIWNNHDKLPPAVEDWPQISQPLQVLPMKKNTLSNRFVPYPEIETEAVFSLDDDILMLTPDEIEFGFQVWLEHSERLVGFPSRLHIRNSSANSWEYDSEWGSKLSMVLTGAAFFSKNYCQYYTSSMPKAIRDYVNGHTNCEDLAMNFLIANMTGKGPVKVGPRKKFRCPKCSNVDMLSADAGHLMERSQCINYFVSVFGFMPLIHAEYRADPVLYKEGVAKEEARYLDIGAL